MYFDNGNTQIRLDIQGYELNGRCSHDEDNNWLVVRLTFADEQTQSRYRVDSACLLTDEAAELLQWLENIRDGVVVKSYCNFLEPCLFFEYEADNLIIGLFAEYAPDGFALPLNEDSEARFYFHKNTLSL
ncbi:hypothetical protein [Neisseria sp. CCUG12390]|uniref:WapI family immunity protein n=1 Tax=Neisseria sp. CCUG12390 TaxID=3392035 RepID=UPI003A0FD745